MPKPKKDLLRFENKITVSRHWLSRAAQYQITAVIINKVRLFLKIRNSVCKWKQDKN